MGYFEKDQQEKFHELAYYTLAHTDPAFIHQHIVDAFGAQTANEDTKPIGISFALIGLYLHLEKNYTGRQVQLAHMQLAKTRKQWPRFELPEERGDITVSEVIAAPPGPERDEMIHKWCESVWDAYQASHRQVAYLAKALE